VWEIRQTRASKLSRLVLFPIYCLWSSYSAASRLVPRQSSHSALCRRLIDWSFVYSLAMADSRRSRSSSRYYAAASSLASRASRHCGFFISDWNANGLCYSTSYAAANQYWNEITAASIATDFDRQLNIVAKISRNAGPASAVAANCSRSDSSSSNTPSIEIP